MSAAIEQVTSGSVNAWIIGDDEEVIVIDPGGDADAVLAAVGERDILAVICTHGHASHVEAAVTVANRDQAPVAVHPLDRIAWREVHPSDAAEIEMADGGIFEVADVQLEVIHTPGHSPGSVSLYCEDLGVVFTGDTVNSEGPALPPGSRKNMITRPFGAKVGPSLWYPSVRIRSPLPSGFITPMANLPPACRVKAM